MCRGLAFCVFVEVMRWDVRDARRQGLGQDDASRTVSVDAHGYASLFVSGALVDETGIARSR